MKKKYLIFLSFIAILFLSGCAANLWVQSDPPGAYAQFKDGGTRPMPFYLEYSWNDEFRNGGCMDVNTTAAVWPDGFRMDPTSLRLCKSSGNIFKYTFVRPPPLQPKPTAVINNSSPSPMVDISAAKIKCTELGFKPGTSEFGGCVLKLSK